MTERNPYHPDGLWPTAGSYTRTDEPDDMDGGVTAALIEKEAEQRACPDLDAHWRLDEAMDRAERAERERDEWKDSAIKAMADLERVEHPRPLTPDAITDEMVERARKAWNRSAALGDDLWRDVLAAALTEPVECSEVVALAEVLGDFAIADEHNGTRDDMGLARALHGRGVRVIAKEDPR